MNINKTMIFQASAMVVIWGIVLLISNDPGNDTISLIAAILSTLVIALPVLLTLLGAFKRIWKRLKNKQ